MRNLPDQRSLAGVLRFDARECIKPCIAPNASFLRSALNSDSDEATGGQKYLSRISDYTMHPIWVEHSADQTVEEGSRCESFVADAAGHPLFQGSALPAAPLMVVRPLLLHTPPLAGFALTGSVDMMLRNLALKRDEINGLMAGSLTSEALLTRAAHTWLSAWLKVNTHGPDAIACLSSGEITEGVEARCIQYCAFCCTRTERPRGICCVPLALPDVQPR